jgi:hypothetical protein
MTNIFPEFTVVAKGGKIFQDNPSSRVHSSDHSGKNGPYSPWCGFQHLLGQSFFLCHRQ